MALERRYFEASRRHSNRAGILLIRGHRDCMLPPWCGSVWHGPYLYHEPVFNVQTSDWQSGWLGVNWLLRRQLELDLEAADGPGGLSRAGPGGALSPSDSATPGITEAWWQPASGSHGGRRGYACRHARAGGPPGRCVTVKVTHRDWATGRPTGRAAARMIFAAWKISYWITTWIWLDINVDIHIDIPMDIQ